MQNRRGRPRKRCDVCAGRRGHRHKAVESPADEHPSSIMLTVLQGGLTSETGEPGLAMPTQGDRLAARRRVRDQSSNGSTGSAAAGTPGEVGGDALNRPDPLESVHTLTLDQALKVLSVLARQGDRGAAVELVKYHERHSDPNEGAVDPFAALDGTG